jgi:hypothetical protein
MKKFLAKGVEQNLDPELSAITQTEKIALGVTVMDMC